MKEGLKLRFNKFIPVLFLLAACSEGGENAGYGNKNLAITISGSQSFNTKVVHGEIDYYQITVSSPDIDRPIVQKIDGKSKNASLVGIPSGENYTVTVEAINPNGMTIRRGKKEGVTVETGQFSKVDLAMVSVPIFINVTNQSAITGNRLVFKIFAEPESHLQIWRGKTEADTILTEEGSGLAFVDTTTNKDGLYAFDPGVLDYGVHTCRLEDIDSGEASQILMTLYEPTIRPGVGLVSAGKVGSNAKDLMVVNVGQPYARETAKKSEGTFLDVMDNLYR